MENLTVAALSGGTGEGGGCWRGGRGLRGRLCLLSFRLSRVRRDVKLVAGFDAGGLGGAFIELDRVFRRRAAGDAGQIVRLKARDRNDLAGAVEINDVQRNPRVLHPEREVLVAGE